MKLSDLMNRIITEYSVEIHGVYNGQMDILSVKILGSQSTFENDTFYVGTPDLVPIEKQDAFILITGIPSDTSSVCYIKETENEITVTQIVNLLSDCFSENYSFQNFKNEIFDTLYYGNGINSILAVAKAYLENPIYVIDASYNLLAPSRDEVLISVGLEDHGDRSFLTSEAIDSFRRNNLTESIYNAKKSFQVCTEYSGYSWIFCPIHINKNPIGFIAICDIQGPFKDSDCALTDIIAHALSLEMQKDKFFTQKTGIKYEFFLTDLLENHIHNTEIIEERLRQLDRVFYSYFWVVTLKFDNNTSGNTEICYLIEYLRSLIPNSMSFFYDSAIVMLVTQKTPRIFSFSILDTLIGYFGHNQMRAGISQYFTNILDISEYYQQSLVATELGTSFTSDKNIHWFSDFNVFHLFKQSQQAIRLDTLIHPLIKQLQKYDVIHNTEFVYTLRAYLHYSRNAAKTSDALHIHRSTFFYRLNTIKEILDTPIDDSRMLFLFELSFEIMDYLHC
ncbi:PucR family transcriptional regulator [Desulfosporosinus fructosivorans]